MSRFWSRKLLRRISLLSHAGGRIHWIGVRQTLLAPLQQQQHRLLVEVPIPVGPVQYTTAVAAARWENVLPRWVILGPCQRMQWLEATIWIATCFRGLACGCAAGHWSWPSFRADRPCPLLVQRNAASRTNATRLMMAMMKRCAGALATSTLAAR